MIAAGRKLPTHGHGASELTLVPDGAFTDEIGEYRQGDIQDIDLSDRAPAGGRQEAGLQGAGFPHSFRPRAAV